MNIIIIGSGVVGTAICAQLALENHAVTVIDKDYTILTEVANTYDVTAIHGNGADVSVLREAGAEKADMLIAVTNEDELNILCCFAAKKLGTRHTAARVRNPEYSEFMNLMKDDINLSLTINPEYAVSKEIYRILRCPSAARLESFCGGLVDLAEFTVPCRSMLVGASLFELRERLKIKFLVCSVRRGDEVYIPSGDFVIAEGDILGVTADESEITKLFKAAGCYQKPVGELIILGGGRTSYYLAELLNKHKVNTVIIERDRARCDELAAEFPGITVINGDGTNQELLIEEGIENADAFLALSSLDEENAIVSMFAKTMSVPKIVTMISSLPYIDFFRSVGIESIVSPKSCTVSYILRFVRSFAATDGSEMESLHKMMNGKTEALEFKINEAVSGVTDIPLRELKKKADCLICCIVREGKVIIPSGDDSIQKSDTVVVISLEGKINSIKDIID